MNKTALQNQIRAAFADVPYPGDNCLGDVNGRDDAERVTRIFKGRSRDSLLAEELPHEAMLFMTPEAFQYYFPAYLLAFDDPDLGDAWSDVLWRLQPCSVRIKNVPHDVLPPLFRNFSSDQKRAIRTFVEYELEFYKQLNQTATDDSYRDEDTEEKLRALQKFWAQF